DEVAADADDVRYLCESGNGYFPSANLVPSDVISTWAGLRPLIAAPTNVEESDVSREHEVFSRNDGLVIIAGGKLTTYRRMARQADRSRAAVCLGRDRVRHQARPRPHGRRRAGPPSTAAAGQPRSGARRLRAGRQDDGRDPRLVRRAPRADDRRVQGRGRAQP